MGDEQRNATDYWMNKAEDRKAEIAELQAERDRLAAQVAAVRALHQPDWPANLEDANCMVCYFPHSGRRAWPCPTLRALDAEPADTPASPIRTEPIGPNGDIGPADKSSKPSESLNTGADSQDNLSSEACPQSKRADGKHSWRFDGDTPFIECVYCDEYRDALTGKPVYRKATQ